MCSEPNSLNSDQTKPPKTTPNMLRTGEKKLPKLFIKLLNSKKYEVSVKRKKKAKQSKLLKQESDQYRSQHSVSSAAQQVLNDFCASTTIHGVKYLNQFSWKSRLFWIAIYVFALWCCGFLVMERYVRWEKNPVIVSFDKRFESISEVPFPSVTICPEAKSNNKIFNYTKVLTTILQFSRDNRSLDFHKLTDWEKDAFQIIAQTSLPKGSKVSEFLIVNNSISNTRVFEILSSLALPLKDICHQYSWGYTLPKQTCNDFSPIVTEDGMCYTFNALDPSEVFPNHTVHGYKSLTPKRLSRGWSRSNGYSTNRSTSSYPFRVYSTREKLVLQLKLSRSNFDNMYPSLGKAFKVYLHSPTEFPWNTKQYFRVNVDQSAILTVTPMMIRTSNQLRDYDAKRRECFFQHENPLNFFKLYTKENCELECLANYSLLLCGCVPYWMPRANESKICTLSNFGCYTQAIYKHLTEALENPMDRSDYSELDIPDVVVFVNKTCNGTAGVAVKCKELRGLWHNKHCYHPRLLRLDKNSADRNASNDDLSDNYDATKIKIKCNCLPSCNSVNYVTDYRTSSFAGDAGINYGDLPVGFRFVHLEIQFRESQFVPMRRSELYSLYDFVSNFGGLFGLFLGMSLMSLFEIIYFSTVRLTIAVRKMLKIESQDRQRQREVADK